MLLPLGPSLQEIDPHCQKEGRQDVDIEEEVELIGQVEEVEKQGNGSGDQDRPQPHGAEHEPGGEVADKPDHH